VAEVLDELLSTHWMITDVDDEPTDAGPNVLSTMQFSWLTVGYHITGHERFRIELQKMLKNSKRINFKLGSIAFFNRYSAYYGNNLAHTNWYNLLRLGKVYFSEDDYNFLLDMFDNQVHTFSRLSHNPWFTSIFIGQGNYTPTTDDPYADQVAGDLEDFRDPPLAQYLVTPRLQGTYTLDPVSVLLHDLLVQYPFLEDLIGGVKSQALEPTTVDNYCPAGFMFQWSPFNIDQCGSDEPTKVHSGHDYIDAYWMAGYHKVVTKDM
jgi:hypothetical protein